MDFFKTMERVTGVDLNDVQRKAVQCADGPLLLLASPGSGKTTTLNMKIGYLLLEKKIAPQRILAMTFSKAAARDMSERFERFFGTLTHERIHFSTIHSLAYQIVRQYFYKTGRQFRLIEGTKDMQWNKKIILRNLFTEKRKTQPTEDEMDELLTYISYVKNRMLEGERLKEVPCSLTDAAEILTRYEEFKRRDGVNVLLDFDDMLTYCYEILRDDEAIRTHYQQQFEYVLTDEGQDNSVIQHEIVRILAAPHNNLCIVADDDQSIFSWRGSDVEKLLEFPKVYPDAVVLTMAQNYRSTKEITDVADHFIKRNKKRYDKKMFTENGHGRPPIIHNMRRYTLQLNYVVEEIERTQDAGEIAVLYRNNTSAIRLVDALEKHQIPFYMKEVDVKFFRHFIIEDILNFMRLTFNDKRADILERIYPKMNAYIKKAQITQLLNKNDRTTSVFDQLATNVHAPYQEQALRKAKKKIRTLKDLPPKDAIQMIRHDLGYEKSLQRTAEHLKLNEDRLLGIVTQLEYIAEGLPDLTAFAKRLTRLEEIMRQSNEKRPGVVTLSTFHSAKGLEFDRVYMIDLVDGIIPAPDDIKEYKDGKEAKMEEAVRLFYVGMTRAKTRLELLTYEQNNEEKTAPSVFLDDVKAILQGEKVKDFDFKEPAIERKAVVTNKSYQQKKVARDIPEDAITERSDLHRGMEIEHHLYSKGYIKRINGNEIELVFEHYGTKQFMIDFCLQKGMLRRVGEV